MRAKTASKRPERGRARAGAGRGATLASAKKDAWTSSSVASRAHVEHRKVVGYDQWWQRGRRSPPSAVSSGDARAAALGGRPGGCSGSGSAVRGDGRHGGARGGTECAGGGLASPDRREAAPPWLQGSSCARVGRDRGANHVDLFRDEQQYDEEPCVRSASRSCREFGHRHRLVAKQLDRAGSAASGRGARGSPSRDAERQPVDTRQRGLEVRSRRLSRSRPQNMGSGSTPRVSRRPSRAARRSRRSRHRSSRRGIVAT